MRNWNKSKRTFWQSRRINFSKKILQFALKLKNPKLKPFIHLKDIAKLLIQSSNNENIACPKNLDVDLDKICFSDLFFPEEFSKLQQGLNKLSPDHPSDCPDLSSLSSYFDKEKLNEWFGNINNSPYETTSTFFVGRINFNPANKRLANLVCSTEIQLLSIDSSFIALSIFVNPSNVFKQKFLSLVKSNPFPHCELSGFNLKHRIFTRTSFKNPAYARKIELEEIFLDMNKAIANLLRENFDAGLSRFGLLPSVEIIKISSSLKEMTKDRFESKLSERFDGSHYNFFRSLGYPFDTNEIYTRNSFWRFYEVFRNELFYQKPHSYQLIMSEMDYKSLENGEIQNSVPIFHSISDELSEIMFLLALEHFYKVLKDLVIGLKTDLDITLSDQAEGKIEFRKSKAAFSKMTILNGFDFYHSRMWVGIDEEILWNYIGRGAKELVRGKYKENDSGILLDDIKRKINRNKKFCNEQLILLRSSYGNLLSCKTLELNLWFQSITLYLSIAVAVLTIVTIVPDENRKVLFNLIVNWSNEYLFNRK